MKNLFTILLCSLVLTAGLTAGGQAEETAAPETIVLTIWDDKSSEEEASVIAALVDEWNVSHDNVKLERDSVGIESYKMKIKNKMLLSIAIIVIGFTTEKATTYVDYNRKFMYKSYSNNTSG